MVNLLNNMTFTLLKKKLFTTSVILFASSALMAQTPCENGFAGIYPCENMDLLAHMTNAEIGGGDNTNDIWGWVSPVTNKEYAIVGCSNGTAFVDISNPTAPVYLGLLPAHTTNSLWRDMETFKDYVFVGSEAGGHGLQVMNLLQLDNVVNAPVTFQEDAHYGQFGNSHTINIDPVSGLLVVMGSNTFSGGLHIIDINDPLNPVLAGGFAEDGYTHDGYVMTYNGPDADYQGHIIVVACNADAVTLVDITNPLDCQLIDTYTYPQTGYVHQGWFSKDHRYFMLDDELDEMDFAIGTRTHIFDFNDLDNMVYMGFHQSNNTSIDHNLYVLDQFVYESNYRSGVRVFDAIRVSDGELYPIGHFDLVPANDLPQFSGTWSNYPFLPSGVNIATSMYDGFFITRPTMVNISQKEFTVCGLNEVTFTVDINADLQFPLTFAIDGLPGSTINSITATGTGTYTVTVGNLTIVTAGVYNARLQLNTTFGEAYEFPLTFDVSPSAPSVPSVLYPDPNAIDQVLDAAGPVLIDWIESPNAYSYTVQIASDNAFNTIIDESTVSTDEYQMTLDLPLGTYYIRVRSNNTCGNSAWSSTDQIQVVVVGVSELSAAQFKAYPNPGNDLLTIESSQELSGKITLTDASGRIILSQQAYGKKLQINTASIATGVYTLKYGEVVMSWVKE
ncbi:MAG: hypothetical protein RLZZ77_1180 [Bacteroidota bacterium]|jgi:choice-of-anchor B domain-containing protein